jgi:DNA-binding NarL/FixJ family response regulator
MIRLLIADDHQMVREGFRRIIQAHSDMEIVAEASDGDQLLEMVEDCDVDVLILDITMPGPGFLKVLKGVQELRPQLPVLVVSMHSEEQWALQAFKAGASGYLTKAHSADELAEGIRRIHGGGKYVTPSVGEALAQRFSGSGGRPPHEILSRREFEVLSSLGSGKMVKTVARELGLSPKTVSTYRSRILEKLNLSSTADLIRSAVEHDLVR